MDDQTLLELFDLVVAGDRAAVVGRLDSSPDLPAGRLQVGASRGGPDRYFLTTIQHHVYAGDTALHVAAATYRADLVELLVASGADVQARNRRGAEPLHYASDGGPEASHWDPRAQHEVIRCLIAAGAGPDAVDRSGVAPLHRAVRNRCSAAVAALLEGGANVRLRNKRGSTPLHLAVRATGKSGSGSAASRDEQGRIITFVLDNGAMPTDVDGHGRSVSSVASPAWSSRLRATAR